MFMENLILLLCFIMFLCGIFALADLWINVVTRRKHNKTKGLFDYKL